MIDGPIKGLRADHSGLGTRAHLPTVSPMADPRGMAYLQEVSTLKGSHVMSSDRKALLGAYKERYQGHMVDPKHRRIRLIGKRVMRESQRQQQALEAAKARLAHIMSGHMTVAQNRLYHTPVGQCKYTQSAPSRLSGVDGQTQWPPRNLAPLLPATRHMGGWAAEHAGATAKSLQSADPFLAYRATLAAEDRYGVEHNRAKVSVLLTQKGPLSETVELKRVGDSKNVLDWRGLLRNEFRVVAESDQQAASLPPAHRPLCDPALMDGVDVMTRLRTIRAMSEVEETKGLKQPEEEEPQEGQRRKLTPEQRKAEALDRFLNHRLYLRIPNRH